MKNEYQIINDLAEKSKSYVYEEKYTEWIREIIISVMEKNSEAKVIVDAMEALSEDKEPSEVLDIIYSTRLETPSILHIIDMVVTYYKDGPQFMRDIYAGLLTTDMEEKIKKIEMENSQYQKKL